MPTVASIILAAGASRRLGEAKQFIRHENETLIHRCARMAGEAGLSPIVVVTGVTHRKIALELSGLDVSVWHHPEWDQGIGSSIRAGVEHVLDIAPGVDAIVISVCDQPFMSVEILQTLVAAWTPTPDRIAAATYGGTVGVPALFPRTLFPRLQELPTDSGAKTILMEMRDTIAKVPFSRGEIDIDTPADRDAIIQGKHVLR